MNALKPRLLKISFGWLIILAALMGCDLDADVEPTPVVVTEIIAFDDGAEFVVTSVVTRTASPTPVPTIPLPESVVELDVGVLGGFRGFDPQLASDDNTLNLIENLYVGLTHHSEATGELEPQLALNWELSADNRTWTFNLRDDIAWVHAIPPDEDVFGLGDGQDDLFVELEFIRPVTAYDIEYAIQRACNRSVSIPDAFILFIIEGCEAVYQLPAPTPEELAVVGVRALDDWTLEVELRQPSGHFLAITSLPLFRPIPADRILDEEIEWLDLDDLVTSGPFVYSPLTDLGREPVPVTILQRNPFWPADLSVSPDETNILPERVNLYQFRASQSALDVFEDDFLDLSPLPRTLVDEFVRPPFAPPPFIAGGDVFYLGFNFDSPAFSVPEVRQAFSAAIDRERLLREVYDRRGLPLRHLSPPSVLYAPPFDEVGVNYSPDYAFFQLANSGYAACQTIGDIHYLIDATDIALQHAESLVRMWVDELGCDDSQFKIEQVQFGTLLARTRSNSAESRPDIFDLAWSGFYPDAHDYMMSVLHCLSGANRPNRPCDEVDILLDAAAQAQDPVERATLYRRAEAGFFSDDGLHPIIPLYVEGEYQLVQDWIVPAWPLPPSGEPQIIGRFNGVRFDTFLINQTLKDLERSQ